MIERALLGTSLILASPSGCTNEKAEKAEKTPAEAGGKEQARADAGARPHLGMKGFELYSWQEGDVWHFTLIAGTNRNKLLDEITSPGDMPGGLFKIHVTGTDAIVAALAELPRGEQVFWLGLPTDAPVPLPPQEMVDSLRAKAAEMGLALSAP